MATTIYVNLGGCYPKTGSGTSPFFRAWPIWFMEQTKKTNENSRD